MSEMTDWEDEQVEKEKASILRGLFQRIGKTPFPENLQTDYDDNGQMISGDRIMSGERYGDLDWSHLRGEKRATTQDAFVYVAADPSMAPDGDPVEFKLKSRSATASRVVASAAGTGLVVRVMVPKGTMIEARPISEGEAPSEEVILPEGASLRVYNCERTKCEGARVIDAVLVV